MFIKNLVFLIIAIIASIFGFYNYLSLELAIALFIIYIFSLGLVIEINEIKTKKSLNSIITQKIGNIEKLILGTLAKIGSDSRIKERISKRKREILYWLNQF